MMSEILKSAAYRMNIRPIQARFWWTCCFCVCRFNMLRLRATRVTPATVLTHNNNPRPEMMTEQREREKNSSGLLNSCSWIFPFSFVTQIQDPGRRSWLMTVFYRSVSRWIRRGDRSAARGDRSGGWWEPQHMRSGRFVCCLFRSCCSRLPCSQTQPISSIRDTVTVFLSPSWALSKFKPALAVMCLSCRAANKGKRAAPESDVHFLDSNSVKTFCRGSFFKWDSDSHSNTI